MLTDRRQRVLRLMLSVERPLTAAEIGRQVECPAHSVRYDLEALDQWVCRLGGQLISTAGVGYHLTGDLDRLQWALDQFTQSSVHEYVLSPRERVRRLLLRLLADSHHHPLQTFADRYTWARAPFTLTSPLSRPGCKRGASPSSGAMPGSASTAPSSSGGRPFSSAASATR